MELCFSNSKEGTTGSTYLSFIFCDELLDTTICSKIKVVTQDNHN